HPPGARVVDDGRAARGGLGRELLADVTAGGEQRDVDAVERLGRRFDDLVGLTFDGHGSAGRPAGGEKAELPDGELALVEDLDHRATDDAGSADDRNGERSWVHGEKAPLTRGCGPGTGRVYQRALRGPMPMVLACRLGDLRKRSA